jgi:ABC-type proline/glycine betaine transport system ATPase subunit
VKEQRDLKIDEEPVRQAELGQARLESVSISASSSSLLFVKHSHEQALRIVARVSIMRASGG